MVSALASASSCPGSSPGWGHCVVFLQGRKKNLKSSCPGPVHFSFQLPPLKYYLPIRRTMFMPYQLHHLQFTV